MEDVGKNIGEAFSGIFSMPPTDVIIGLVCILIFGITLGALLYLPVAHKSSRLPLEKLSNELIWRYAPDWFILIIGCIAFLTVSFFMVSGFMRNV